MDRLSAIVDRFLDDYARLALGPPHLIREVVEHYFEEIEALRPLDARLERLPSIDAQVFALPFRFDQGLVDEGSEAYVDAPEDTRHWDDFEGLDYAGVRDHYAWSLVEPEDLADELTVEADEIMPAEAASEIAVEADAEIAAEADEITADIKAPPSLAAAKPLDPMTPNSMWFEGIISEGSHIATIGVVQNVGSTTNSLAFGPTLERRQ